MIIKITDLRKERSISQKELAKYLNVSQAQISKYESGANEPDLATLIKIADFFNISIDELLGHNKPNYLNLSQKDLDEINLLLKSLSDKLNRVN